MSKMNRRDFLKHASIGSTATAAACSIDPPSWDPLVPLERAYPYVVQPEQVVPGVSTYFATICDQADPPYGILANVREGRVIGLEGNKKDTLIGGGALCAQGHSALLESYSPDRFMGIQKGGKPGKDNNFMKWDETATMIAEKVKAAGNKVAWIGKYRTGATGAVVNQFFDAVKGKQLFWEPQVVAGLKAATKAVFGIDGVPTYQLESAKAVISFGAEYLGSWGQKTTLQRSWAKGRKPKKVGDKYNLSHTISVGPRVGQTAACSDTHLITVPGTETGVALAIAKMVMQKNGYNGPLKSLLSNIDAKALLLQAAAKTSTVEKIVGLLVAGSSVALPGGVETSADPTGLAIASLVLNEVLGNINKTVTFGSQNVDNRNSAKEVCDLILSAGKGEIDVLFVDNLDLVYPFPGSQDLLEALKKVKTLVFFANEPNDSITDNAIVIPPGTGLESWGDAEPYHGYHLLRQPVMRPQNKIQISGSAEDFLLKIASINKTLAAVATPPAATPAATETQPAEATEKSPEKAVEKKAKNAEATPAVVAAAPVGPQAPNLNEASFQDYLYKWWEAKVHSKHGNGQAYKDFWIQCQQNGGSFSANFTPKQVNATASLSQLPVTSAAKIDGSGNLNLIVFPHPQVGDGRLANRSWLQEVPDALSGFSWGSWVEINVETAKKLGLTKDKGVKVQTANGTVEVGWFGSPGVEKDTVSFVMGNGHVNSGRYAGYGSNPTNLYKRRFDASGELVHGLIKANVSISEGLNAPSDKNFLLKSDTLTKNHRYVNFTVSKDDIGKGEEYKKQRIDALRKRGRNQQADQAEKLVKASIVPEHHLPDSSMAVTARHTVNRYDKDSTLTDMYPEPEHPTYRFAMAIDLNSCTGCGACQVACYAENNIPVVGPEQARMGRRMGWIRLSRYWEGDDENPDIRFQPVMCQQCSHAPCEGVCPVLATYHNLDGLNAMIYNRCVGTRYCGNNCPYSARRFNYHTYRWPTSFNLMLNPDVIPREMGVMEKCTFCVQRIRSFKDKKRDEYGFTGAQKIQKTDPEKLKHLTACASACPSECITFGNLKDENGPELQEAFNDERSFLMLGELNNKPGVAYLAKVVHTESQLHHGHGGHDDHGGHGDHKSGHGHGNDKSGNGHDHGHGTHKHSKPKASDKSHDAHH